jgi:PAS domain S-box-containing protein
MGPAFPILENFDQAKEVLEKTFECCPDALLVSDPEGRIVQCNPQMESTFGYSRSELLGQPVEVLIPGRFRKIHPAHRGNYISQPRMRAMGIGLELHGRRKDGSEFPVDIMLNSVQTANGALVLSVIRDITRFKQTEDILRQSEEHFHLLVENVRDYAIFMMDTSGHVISWNPGAERLKGYRADDIIGRSFSCFYTSDDIERGTPEESLRLAAAQDRFEREGWRVRKDGSRFWANAVITSIRDDSGNLIGFAKVTRDFSERKKTEEALKQSEQQMRSLFEFSPDAIVSSDQEGKITAVNSGMERLFGYKREELLGQSVDIMLPERFRSVHPSHRKAYSVQASVRPMGLGLELYGRRKDGTEFPVDIMLSPIETAEGQVVLSVIRDITERKKAEEVQSRLAAIVGSSDEAIISESHNGIITSWNASAEDIFGFTAEEAVGQPTSIIIPPEFTDEMELLRRLRSGERIEHQETVRVTKAGKRLSVSLTISPVKDLAGNLIGASKILRDITEQKESEQAAFSARLILTQEEERKRIARELHDSLGQSLAFAKMNLDSLRRPEATEKENQTLACLADALDTCLTETRTISHLLFPPLLDELGLVSAANVFVDGFSARSGIHVNLDIPPDLKRLPPALELGLFRILQESLVNVHRHSHSTSVDIQLRLSGEVTLEVRDHGQGMPAESLKRFRANMAGRSVGLRGMETRVSELGGRFDIQSDKRGTLIRVTVPLPEEVKKTVAACGKLGGA